MHLVLLKAVGFFSVPSNVIASLALLGLLLVVVWRPVGAIVAPLALATLLVATLSPLGNALLTPLEQRFPELSYPDQGIDGIIVLGGSYDSVSHSYASTMASPPTAFRSRNDRKLPKRTPGSAPI